MATSISEAYGLCTASVKESILVTARYFKWSTHSVALFLAFLGLTVLPVNWVIGSYASNIFQDRVYCLCPSPAKIIKGIRWGELVAALKSDVVKVGMRDIQWRSPFHQSQHSSSCCC